MASVHVKCLLLTALVILTLGTGCGKPAATAPNPPVEVAPAPPAPPVQPAAPPAPELPGALLVMVENSDASRPQAGVDKADLVYEIEAEGGITRFLTVFYRHKAEKIGPVRSARFYFVQIAKAYGAPYAHAGANADALAMLARDHDMENMDEIYGSGDYFWRSKDRQAPHNLYTSTDLLLKGAAAKHYRTPVPPALPVGETPGGTPQTGVSLVFNAKYAVVNWQWDGHRYWRQMNGEPHLVEGAQPLQTDNLVVLLTDMKVVYHPPEPQLDVRMLGEGDAVFFSRGKTWQGRWRKSSPDAQIELTSGGAPFQFAPGQVWISVLPDRDAVRSGSQQAG